MNNTRRKQLSVAIDNLNGIEEDVTHLLVPNWLEQVDVIVSTALEEERAYFDNMPESFQNGEKGSKAENAIDALEEAQQGITELVEGKVKLEDAISDIVSLIETACE